MINDLKRKKEREKKSNLLVSQISSNINQSNGVNIKTKATIKKI
jgi:hypothetical protein